MKILALETSTETASVALLDGDRLLERSVAGRPGHSETILPEIRLLLAEAGVALDALDAIAFGAGPGAFTGLRLACGVAQGLAMGLGKPVIPVLVVDEAAHAALLLRSFKVIIAGQGRGQPATSLNQALAGLADSVKRLLGQ